MLDAVAVVMTPCMCAKPVVARKAAQWIDVITSIDPGTGYTASVEKAKALREGAGKHPIALSSGVPPKTSMASYRMSMPILWPVKSKPKNIPAFLSLSAQHYCPRRFMRTETRCSIAEIGETCFTNLKRPRLRRVVDPSRRSLYL